MAQELYRNRKHTILLPKLSLCPPACFLPIRRLPRGRALKIFTRTFRLCATFEFAMMHYYRFTGILDVDKHARYLLYLWNYNPRGFRYLAKAASQFDIGKYYAILSFVDRGNFATLQHSHR